MLNGISAITENPVIGVFLLVFQALSATVFIWGPVLLVYIAQKLWLEYVQMVYRRDKFHFIILEVKLPRTIEKTPLAMEIVLNAFYEGSGGNWYDRWWGGKVRPWFSLELVSVEGNVKFLIRTPSQYKKVIESHIYAQYPDIELIEVQDYISLAPYMREKDEWSMWGCEFALTKPDPYPIKTYVDFGLDSTMTKEEFKSDPLTSTIEFLGSIGRGQQIWMQILIQPNIPRYRTPGTWFGHHDWKEEGKAVIKQLQAKYSGDGGEKASKRQSEVMSAIERSLSKLGFDCGIRAIYIAKRENYDPANIAGITGAFRQYSSQDLNGFKPTNTPGFDYPWQDYHGLREEKRKKKLFDAYIRRSYFYPPYKKKPFVLNTEELATIYHFPGGVAETPTFERIESKKGEPPPNLPV